MVECFHFTKMCGFTNCRSAETFSKQQTQRNTLINYDNNRLFNFVMLIERARGLTRTRVALRVILLVTLQIVALYSLLWLISF